MLSLAHMYVMLHEAITIWNIETHLVPEMLDGHVLAVNVQSVVLGHGQHLFQVVLHGGAVLVVDGVAITCVKIIITS